jgi:hypothetical protein
MVGAKGNRWVEEMGPTKDTSGRCEHPFEVGCKKREKQEENIDFVTRVPHDIKSNYISINF